MAREFKLPELGEGVEAGDVLKVLVSAGDTIAADQSVLEIETDKATIEVPVPFGGKVKEVRVREGDKIHVGQIILIVEAAEAKEAEPAAPGKAEAALVTQPAANLEAPETPLAPVEMPERTPSPTPSSTVAGSVISLAVSPSEAEAGGIVPAAPSVRRIARELGVDIGQVRGSGPAGRISMDDVKEHAKGIVSGRSMPGGPLAVQASLPDFGKWGPVERQTMSNVRRKTAEHLTQGWVAPHVTNHDRADITELEKLRKRYASRAEAGGGKLTVTAIALKVAALALRRFPQFNASIDMERQEVIFKKYYNIGVAVDTDRGLLVPVIRDVEQKNILELSIELTEVAEKARSRKLGLEDMQGGTFTITNLGGIGGSAFTPIVNWPEVAILGISRGGMKPVWIDGEFVPRLMLPLSLSYDHRLIDGADAARFLRWLAEAFENPFVLALEG
jgi:pyruvate dehydrogenase E2 component (dihydrolipoamide acetyltransferase)